MEQFSYILPCILYSQWLCSDRGVEPGGKGPRPPTFQQERSCLPEIIICMYIPYACWLEQLIMMNSSINHKKL